MKYLELVTSMDPSPQAHPGWLYAGLQLSQHQGETGGSWQEAGQLLQGPLKLRFRSRLVCTSGVIGVGM